jgi:hypothetical protein
LRKSLDGVDAFRQARREPDALGLVSGRLSDHHRGGANVVETGRLERDHRHLARETLRGPAHLRVGHRTNFAELLRDDQVGGKKAQHLVVQAVEARPFVDGVADMAIDG